MTYCTRIVYTPAGKCPIKLEGFDYDTVLEWSNLIIEHGKANNLNYLPPALLFFAQQFYRAFTPEYLEIKEHLNNIFLIPEKDVVVESFNDKKETQKIEQVSEVKLDNKKKRGRASKKNKD